MKKLSRLIFASLSTLLLAAGFSRAAESIDPVSLGATQTQTASLCPDCGNPCGACDAAEQ